MAGAAHNLVSQSKWMTLSDGRHSDSLVDFVSPRCPVNNHLQMMKAKPCVGPALLASDFVRLPALAPIPGRSVVRLIAPNQDGIEITLQVLFVRPHLLPSQTL